ncbi:uncharacterized protein LAESUDRAFT_644337 [Laetiporus sulphureus 93-53]|uniref:Pentatricopeptide repeat-containing protein-mitochondrial domain-containing protein n=1 Tax=Laetiporus sulphureus 93-53 TaxID=1314785 RepID=A0A165GS40_9APHY|nr:uncharacterized protein LAESUDRAFT_644337 [Laetiporus sulphureus 93-53]KZT10732.1 hypothetical protein LAESUDRAFT_644337 [Laetiporus sulphureus 93-53]
MKDEGVQPDATTYEYILEACASEGRPAEARAAFDDMLAMGIQPTRTMFHHLLYVLRREDAGEMWSVLETMRQFLVAPNETTYEIIILRYTQDDHIELALQNLAEMGARGLSPTLKTATTLIESAGRLGYPRLALELAEAFEATSVRRLDGDVWLECLLSSAEALYEDGVLRTWQKVVHELHITPDEGCCLQVLHAAGRNGLAALGLDVLQVLGKIGVAWEEYHFAPVIEALCKGKEKNLKDALAMLDLIRSHDITPGAETAFPIFEMISKDADSVDEAWGILETLHEEGKNIDITAINVVVQASVAIGDLQRAVGTYKTAGKLGVKPNIDTYNLLLAGCIAAQHRPLGDRLLTEMKEAKIKPDIRTYERLIVLCLTQTVYEDAFFYLEEMKTEGHLPPLAVYEAIIRKCVALGDPRYKLAVEELLECGYELSSGLNSFIQSGGTHDGSHPKERPRSVERSFRTRTKREDFLRGVQEPVELMSDQVS